MRSNLPFIVERIAANLAESGTSVQVNWRDWAPGWTVDPVNQSRVGTPTPMSKTVKAFLHFPMPGGNSQVRQFNEIELGDCIADFQQDIELDGLDALEFVFLDCQGEPIDNQVWVTKPVSERLAQTWAVVQRGQRLFRTVLLRKKT